MNMHTDYETAIERARNEAHRRSNGQATERACESCRGDGVAHHVAMKRPTGEITCDPCCACAGYRLEFHVRTTTPVLLVWDLLGEPRPRCWASAQPHVRTQ